MSNLLKTTIRLIFLGCLLLPAAQVSADPYYNSSEPGCDGSDPNVAFCDDFEDGVWYATDCDTSGGSGNVTNDGWCGSIYANPITPAGAAVCGAGVTPFGNCAGTGGTKSGGRTDRNLAWHHLKTASCGSSGTQLCSVPTLYVRWYAKWQSGYQFGAEKHMNFTNDHGDIAFANIQVNCGAGGAGSTGSLSMQVIHGENMCDQILGITIQSNRWYFFEMRVTAHPTAGVIQVWINDCGTAGTSCGASPTLRYNRSGLRLPGNSNGSQIQTIWLESWANPPSVGTGPLWDQVKASIVGPIGFSGFSTLPAPANLRVQ